MPAPVSKKLCTADSERIAREFVDNWSHYVSLLDLKTEENLLNLLDLLESVRKSWQQSEAECNKYKVKVSTLEKSVITMKQENDSLHDLYRNCQSQLNHLSNSKRDVEEELAEYKRLWEQLRNVIKSNDQTLISDGLLAVINGGPTGRHSPTRSNFDNTTTSNIAGIQYDIEEEKADPVSTMESSQSDIDYDKTAESVNSSFEHNVGAPRRVSRKRRSRSQNPDRVRFDPYCIKEEVELESGPSKRSRNGENTEITATIRIDPNGNRKPSGTVQIRRSMNRSMSESTLVEKREKMTVKPKAMTPHYGAGRSTYDLRSPHGFANSWTLGHPIERRAHRVTTFIAVWESCDVCTKRFGITAQNALKCIDCNLRFHRHCQSRAPMPCIPKVVMPKTPSKQIKCGLVHYCPEQHPFIPPILIHCVIALEKDRLSKEGIYRLPGQDSNVAKLYEVFMSSRPAPNLSNIETEIITGCIKKFLMGLRDSLIPSTSYDDFIKAIEAEDEQKIASCILELPAPNRDTLAYFILHLQKVANNSSQNKMPIENLAHVLAPTVVGYSKLVTPDPGNYNELCRNQYMILFRLLKIPAEFWNRFIVQNMSAVLAKEDRVPGSQKALLTITPTRDTPTTTRSSRRACNNNNRERAETEQNGSPLIQPLRMAPTSSGAYFQPAL